VAKLSQKQLDANRRNAQLSTGPKTETGKAIVARNATTHGLLARHSVIKGELQEEFDAFHAEIFADMQPVGMLEIVLLDKIVTSLWQQQRVSRIENDMIDKLSIPPKASGKGGSPFNVTFVETIAGEPGVIYPKPKPEPKPKPQPAQEPDGLTIGQTFINDIEGSNILMKFRRYSKEIDSGLYKAIKEFYWLQEKRFKKEVIEAERTD